MSPREQWALRKNSFEKSLSDPLIYYEFPGTWRKEKSRGNKVGFLAGEGGNAVAVSEKSDIRWYVKYSNCLHPGDALKQADNNNKGIAARYRETR